MLTGQMHAQFIHEIAWEHIPEDVQHQTSRCLLDLCGTLIAGAQTAMSRVAREVAFNSYGGDRATLLLDGRRTSAAGAALANSLTIDALDMHDGYRPAKGHAGAGVFPVALAAVEQFGWTGPEMLSGLVVGYEIGLRAAQALHRRASVYFSSGSWLALGSAAVWARALRIDEQATRHALGVADYHAPRSEMMRCIDHPSMLKDGIGWGSMTGVVSAELAAAGFTGAPASIMEVEAVSTPWDDLGTEWRMRELYFKPYPCCRWAQPAIEAARSLLEQHQLQPEAIAELEVHTFAEAARLQVIRPENTEQAQYSLPYPLAAALIHGGLEPAQVLPPNLEDPRVLQLADKVVMRVDSELDARFPAEALARLRLTTADGHTLESGVTAAAGDAGNPLSDQQIREKYRQAVAGLVDEQRAEAIEQACWECSQLDSALGLVELLTDPIRVRTTETEHRTGAAAADLS